MTSAFFPLASPLDLQKQFPLLPHLKRFVLDSRKAAENIMRGEDERLVVLTGPCSIHDRDIAIEYAKRLKDLQRRVEDEIFLIMRVFIEKPRTQFGWKGFVYDPSLDGSYEIEKGLSATRELLLDITKLEVPIATEFLDPLLPSYHGDLVTWGIIGARTAASQIHRQMASHLDMPIGFKNETDGTVDNAICGALAARHPQASIGIDEQGKICSLRSQGNPHTHLILRGANDGPNYDHISISETIQRQRLSGLNSRLLIDCSHGNSQKDIQKQKGVFLSVLDQIHDGNHLIMGMMLESHLQGGNALSLTDPCLDWKSTEDLLLWAHASLSAYTPRVQSIFPY